MKNNRKNFAVTYGSKILPSSETISGQTSKVIFQKEKIWKKSRDESWEDVCTDSVSTDMCQSDTQKKLKKRCKLTEKIVY